MVAAHQPHSTGASAVRLRQDLALSRERMARLIDVSSKTIERWENADAAPSSTRMRLQFAQLQTIRDLGLAVYSLEGFRLFLRTPLSASGDRTPLQLIEQGRADEVIAALAADHEGLGP